MVDYDSRQLTWVRSVDGTHFDTITATELSNASLSFQDGTYGTDTYHYAGPAPAEHHRHWMIESVILRYYDSAASTPDFVVWFWSSSEYDNTTLGSDTFLGHVDFATADVTIATAAYQYWDDHDVRIAYTITADNDASANTANPYLHVSLQPSANVVAGDKTELMVGLRPLSNS